MIRDRQHPCWKTRGTVVHRAHWWRKQERTHWDGAGKAPHDTRCAAGVRSSQSTQAMTNRRVSKNILPGVCFSRQLHLHVYSSHETSTPDLVIERAFSQPRQGASDCCWRYEYAQGKKFSSSKTLRSRTLLPALQRERPDANLNSQLLPKNLDSQFTMRAHH